MKKTKVPKKTNQSLENVIRWMGSVSITQEEAEARLHQEGYRTFCWYDVPGMDYPIHSHSYDECLWVIHGELIITVDHCEIVLKSGDRVYLPHDRIHTARVPENRSVTYLVGQKKH